MIPMRDAPVITLAELRQQWKRPRAPREIVCIGTGGIVRGAHLPAYRAIGFEIAGVFDIDAANAAEVASVAKTRVFATLDEAIATPRAVFDIAVPPEAIASILRALPVGSAALVQKPFGRDLAEASRLLALCHARNLTVAVNFQLRFSPAILALCDLLARGALGRIVDCETSVHCTMPWELWPFLAKYERMEFLMHSIHYLDLTRALLGEPKGVWAQTVQHPSAMHLASSKSAAILDYGSDVRALVMTNHHHSFGGDGQRSELRLEGTQGAAIATFGANLAYPEGEADTLRVHLDATRGWESIALRGSWFIEAFEGPMCNLQRFVAGEDETLVSSALDACKTMALVEACYASQRAGSTPIASFASDA